MSGSRGTAMDTFRGFISTAASSLCHGATEITRTSSTTASSSSLCFCYILRATGLIYLLSGTKARNSSALSTLFRFCFTRITTIYRVRGARGADTAVRASGIREASFSARICAAEG